MKYGFHVKRQQRLARLQVSSWPRLRLLITHDSSPSPLLLRGVVVLDVPGQPFQLHSLDIAARELTDSHHVLTGYPRFLHH